MPKRQSGGKREEVYNIRLADMLEAHGIISDPESIQNIEEGRRLPDVIVTDIMDIKTCIEGRVFSGAATLTSLEEDSKKRIIEGLCSVCVAVAYPEKIRQCTNRNEIEEFFRQTNEFQIKVVTADKKLTTDWFRGNLTNLEEVLRQTGQNIVSDEAVSTSQSNLNSALNRCETAFVQNKTLEKKLKGILGVSPISEGT